MTVKIPKRGMIYNIVEKTVIEIVKRTSTIHLDMPPKTLDTIISDDRKLYVGLHKSMWETFGVPCVLKNIDARVPYVVIAKTLIGRPFRPILKHIGLLFVDTLNQKEGLKDMERQFIPTLKMGEDIMVFPEGKRTRDGKINPFSGITFEKSLEYSQDNKLWIIPFNNDYTKLNDLERMYRKKMYRTNKKYKFMLHHSLEWLKNLGEIYTSFGEPINVKDFSDRKELKTYVNEQCKNLVHILPNNIYATAAIRAGYDFKEETINKYIVETLTELAPQKNKFVGIENSSDVITKSTLETTKNERLYKLFSGYIDHYLKK